MQWVDVAGPPGSGKSTLCDPLWGPREPAIDTSVKPPEHWHDFLNEVTRLLGLIRRHPSFVAAVRMNRRTAMKMATVAHMRSDKPYVQAGFIQRGLGFGWRLNDMGSDLEELRHYFRLMPVSVGCVFLECPKEIVEQRNRDREKVKATAHENRAYQVPLMLPAIEKAKGWLEERGVPVLALSTEQDIDAARKELTEFSQRDTPETVYENTTTRPVWW